MFKKQPKDAVLMSPFIKKKYYNVKDSFIQKYSMLQQITPMGAGYPFYYYWTYIL
jgi:hypothetical protein